MTFGRMGVRYGKHKARDGRWGRGRVHLVYYDNANKVWEKDCRQSRFGEGADPNVPDDAEITCKLCPSNDDPRYWPPDKVVGR